MSQLPTVVIIGGPPATGKTTLARRISAELRLPWAGKDTYKELLFDALGARDRAWSRQLSRASVALLLQFVETHVAAGRSCVVESNFYPQLDTPQLIALQRRHPFAVVQIQCLAQGPLLLERFLQRADSPERHAGHGDLLYYKEFEPVLLSGRLAPLALEGRLIELDTTSFASVDYAGLLAELAALGLS